MSLVGYRAASEADQPYMRRLFGEYKAPMFAPLGLAAEQLNALLDMQYRARSIDYARRHPGLESLILTVDGRDVGMALLERGEGIRLIDIIIDTPERGRGFGTDFLHQLLVEASSNSRKIMLYVEPLNPAKRLYERLGFTVVAADAMNCLMEWSPNKAICADK